MSADNADFVPGTHTRHPAGFPDFPAPLWGVDELAVRCTVDDIEPSACDGWEATVAVDPADIRLDGAGLLHFDNDDIPTACPECGSPNHLSYNGVEVSHDV